MEPRVSYCNDWSVSDYYESEQGVFRGSLSGFVVHCLFRDQFPNGLGPNSPADPSDEQDKILIGNAQEGAVDGDMKGWVLGTRVTGAAPPQYFFNYGDSAESVVEHGGEAFVPACDQRSLLITVAFGWRSVTFGGAGVQSVATWINGDSAGIGPETIANGYTPADATNPFQVGNRTPTFDMSGGPDVSPAFDCGIGGFAFRQDLPGTNLDTDDTTLLALSQMHSDLWNATQQAYDMNDEGAAVDAGELFSTRRGNPNAGASWASQNGSNILTRQGSALSVGASRPNWYDGQVG